VGLALPQPSWALRDGEGGDYSVMVLFEFKSCYFKNSHRKHGSRNVPNLCIEVKPAKQASHVSPSSLPLLPALMADSFDTQGKKNETMIFS
jgi:hypothetical protein